MKKYIALPIVAIIYRIIGWIILIGGIIFSIVAGREIADWLQMSAVWAIILGIVLSILSGLGLLALANLFYVIMDIEENTRR